MNIHRSPYVGDQDDKGFTLIEILIAIVLVGILSAVAVVGISNLVSKGGTSACNASKDSATAASAVYFASQSNTYPITLKQMVDTGVWSLPSGVNVNTAAVAPVPPAVLPPTAAIGMQASSGTSWYLTMTAGSGTAAPTFDCKP